MITEILISAMIAAESNGNNLSVGDEGEAIGCLQIHWEVISDVNLIYGTEFVWPESCYSRENSIVILRLYLKNYAPNKATDEQLARIWNSGPNGWKNSESLKYWKRVKAIMHMLRTGKSLPKPKLWKPVVVKDGKPYNEIKTKSSRI